MSVLQAFSTDMYFINVGKERGQMLWCDHRPCPNHALLSCLDVILGRTLTSMAAYIFMVIARCHKVRIGENYVNTSKWASQKKLRFFFSVALHYTARNLFRGWGAQGFPTPEIDFPSLHRISKVYI